MYDIKALLEEANALTVAQYLGMDIRRKGSRYFIRCPGHEQRLGKPDNKIGNCVIFDNGYRCFACGTSVGIIQMVQEVTGCKFPEALDIIAETCGGADLFQSKGYKTVERQPLSLEDLKIIGFNPVYDGVNGIIINASDVPTFVDDLKKDFFVTKKGQEFLVYKKHEVFTLSRLFMKNKKLYKEIVAQKAKEAMIKYETAIRLFCSRDAKKANLVFDLLNEGNQISDDVFFKIAMVFQNKYWRAKEIYEEFAE